jgi:cellulose synthase/poly-beta-1,6-N-acetylglucosamine synthase-like glycosyltransferase
MTFWAPWDAWQIPSAEPGAMLTGGMGGVVFLVLFCALVDFVKLLVELMGRSEERSFTSDHSTVTAVIPSRNGAERLPMTVGELCKHIPSERILVVDDGSTDRTSAVATELGCTVHRFEKGKGKAAAINFAVHRVGTPLTLLLDDDTRMGGARIPTSLLSEDGFDAAAFHVLPDRRNREGSSGNNFLGALQRYEYGKSMEIGKRFHDVTESVSCISGAVGLFRTRDLDRLHHRHTGVFQAEDLQRTVIHLLERRRIVFANEPVWTVAPSTWAQWLSQRLTGWYPGHYHQLANFVRLLFSRGASWRLRYEMMYNLYTVLSDPIKVWSMAVIAFTPSLRWWGVVVYLTYLAFEIYPYWVVRVPGARGRTPFPVLLLYPLYGALNTVLRTASLATWFWFRYVTGSMRPRTGPKDRIE